MRGGAARAARAGFANGAARPGPGRVRVEPRRPRQRGGARPGGEAGARGADPGCGDSEQPPCGGVQSRRATKLPARPGPRPPTGSPGGSRPPLAPPPGPPACRVAAGATAGPARGGGRRMPIVPRRRPPPGAGDGAPAGRRQATRGARTACRAPGPPAPAPTVRHPSRYPSRDRCPARRAGPCATHPGPPVRLGRYSATGAATDRPRRPESTQAQDSEKKRPP
jgi:hypothetical protein